MHIHSLRNQSPVHCLFRPRIYKHFPKLLIHSFIHGHSFTQSLVPTLLLYSSRILLRTRLAMMLSVSSSSITTLSNLGRCSPYQSHAGILVQESISLFQFLELVTATICLLSLAVSSSSTSNDDIQQQQKAHREAHALVFVQAKHTRQYALQNQHIL